MTVNEIYLTAQDLMSKDHSGYFDNDEFNRLLKLSENTLFEYYLAVFERSRVLSAPISPFKTEADLSISGGVYPFPNNYRHRIELMAKVVDVVDGVVTITQYPAYFLNAGSIGMTITSPIRKPSITKRKFNFEENENGFILYPSGTYPVRLVYFRDITYAVRAVTINDTTLQEDYDSDSSTQPEWSDSEFDNLVDLMLFYKGLRVRENAVIEWVAAKKNLTIVPEKAKL